MVIFKIVRKYELWYHSHHNLSINPFDMKSMSIKFDKDILTSFSQAFEIEMYNHWLFNILMKIFI